MEIVKKPQNRGKVAFEKIKERVIEKMAHFDTSKIPSKWELLGEVVVLKNNSKLGECSEEEMRTVAESFQICLSTKKRQVKCVVIDQEGIKGELRKPTTKILINNLGKESAETIHTENNVKYHLDPCKVMFASGNGTERMRFSKINAEGQVVVDMFAGIGYFSIPLAKFGKPKQVISIEKNPDSFKFLNMNVRENKVEHVKTILGDNRETTLSRCADRVIMGYIPTPKEFLVTAIKFLNLREDQECVVHYHHVCSMFKVGI